MTSISERAVAPTYDALNRAIFLRWGGSSTLRKRLVAALGVTRGHRVLELGCGTGLVTEHLVNTGAAVTAIDRLPEMQAGARRRAPSATFVEADLRTAELGTGYDRVAMSFVLHNLDRHARVHLLTRAAAALVPGGRIGILDWATPADAGPARRWRRFVTKLEPSPNTVQILDGALASDAAAASLHLAGHEHPAGGRAQILILEPTTSTPAP